MCVLNEMGSPASANDDDGGGGVGIKWKKGPPQLEEGESTDMRSLSLLWLL